jgi:hypothetical protein
MRTSTDPMPDPSGSKQDVCHRHPRYAST